MVQQRKHRHHTEFTMLNESTRPHRRQHGIHRVDQGAQWDQLLGKQRGERAKTQWWTKTKAMAPSRPAADGMITQFLGHGVECEPRRRGATGL